MDTIYQTWAETVALFERRGFPQESYDNLDEDEYILHPGPAVLPGSLWLDDHQYRHQNPWIKAGGRPEYEGIDGAVTGYVIDGDLQVDGNILNLDYGSPSLIVLGDLKVANLVLSGSSTLLVQGDIVAETFVGNSTDQYVEVRGDLRAALTVLWDEFVPEVGGSLRGRAVVPEYLDPAAYELTVEDPAPDTGLSGLLVPEVLIADGDSPGDDTYLAEAGLRYEHLLDRLVRGLPAIRGGRTVAALEELPPTR
ncbi:hypothetical protein [Streptomyces sp. SID13726]|uniref:hypothetical protein n=1 Tax=Streptomyces sp. SID13726 TaxID=2706058 RepID=UPI0013BD8700|nr:hypothetical protein [Streptomyces sp. SID13726]NEA97998.1 hypothetical protein [Streptomyces sp. SID13726]